MKSPWRTGAGAPPDRDEEEPREPQPLDWRVLVRLFQYTRPYRARRNTLFVLAAVRSIQLTLLTWAVGSILKGPIATRHARGLAAGLAGYYALALVTVITHRYRSLLALELGENIVHDLRAAMFRHLLRMPMSFFHRTRPGRILNRFASDLESVRVGVQDVAFVGLVQMGQMLVSAILMCRYDAVMFAVLLAMAPLVWALNRYFRTRIAHAHRAAMESFSRVTAAVAESVRGVRVIQGFVRYDRNTQIFRDLVTDHAQYNLRGGRATAAFMPLLELNTQMFVSALIIFGGYRVLHGNGTLPVGHLIQFFVLANLFFAPIHSLANLYTRALTAMVGAERVFRFLDTAPDWEDSPDTVTPTEVKGRVEFDHVSFEYVPGRPVLREVSFVVEPGQSVALVGATGSGKTTLTHLIGKFYLPTHGVVRIDGHDIRTLRGEALRRHMGIVLQQNFLFTGTVLENIRMGRPVATEEEVIAAVKALDCLDLLENLPDGLETRVGENGMGLSLGQRQVICFARAMLANPRILILDEATSAVDAVTERRLQEALARLLVGRTSFVIAHRLSTVRQANITMVLDHGRLVEMGHHRDLLRRKGPYARMYREFLSLLVG